MADYIDSEAEESEEEEDLSPEQRRKLKKFKREQDDEEDEEDDEEQLAEEMRDLIDDGDVESGEDDDDDDSDSNKRKRDEEDEDDFDDRLEDEDYDLIEENLGVKVQRKKFRRLQQLQDDESDEDENETSVADAAGRARDTIANELFEGSEEEGAERAPRAEEPEEYQDPSDEGEGDYSDPDDFIVDDEGQPLTKGKRKRPRFTDAALQQAQDIFGVEFDFNEFDTYNEDYEEDGEEELEYEEEETAEGEVAEVRRRPKKTPKKKRTRKSIFEVYEPSELERGHFTDKDNEIRATDMPERFQLRGIPVTPAKDEELQEEAEWIYKHAFAADSVSCQENDFKTRNAKAAALADLFGDKDKTAAKAATPAAGDDWDADVASSPAAPMAADTEEDWDAELGTDDTTKTPKAAEKSAAADKAPSGDEDWDAEASSPKPAEKAKGSDTPATTAEKDDRIAGDEDWDADGGDAPAASPARPSTSKAASKVEEPAAPPPVDQKRINTIDKIFEALKFMRNQQFEVPFIAFYRKEYVEPELNITDLWRVYYWDEKWCQLSQRKDNLIRLLQKMQDFQADEIMRHPDRPLAEDLRVLSEEDVERVRRLQTFEELKDAYQHLVLYYGADIPRMQEALARKRREERARRVERVMNEDGEVEERVVPPADGEEDAAEADDRVKQASRVDGYTLCRRAGLDALAKKFGLTPHQFGENLRDNYQRHEVDQYPVEPLEAALDHISGKFPTAEEVLKGARFMVATQIAREPLVRQCVREVFFERAKICIKATKKGSKEIDESHSCYPFKYLKNKPVKELKDDIFLKLAMAEEDKLLTISLGLDMEGKSKGILSYVDEIKQLYHRDEFSNNVQEWNNQRVQVIDLAMTKFIYPVLQKELRSKLMQEGRDFVIKACCRRLYGWLKVASYTYDNTVDDDEDYDTSNGIRVFAVAYIPDHETAGFGALVEADGEMSEFIRLPHVIVRRDCWNEARRENKASELGKLKSFIQSKKPHVIVVCGESRDATNIVEELKSVVSDLVESEQMPQVAVELLDNELAKVFMNSNKAETDFRDYPPLLKQAISLARRMQDPLSEFSQLCTPDEEILCMQYHPLQDQIPRDELLNALYLEFVNRTNEVGVDVNRCVAHPHTTNLVQFICGLGPRKGLALIKTLKQTNSRLENRTQLVTVCHMGPKVFINCAGFIKIDTNSLGDSTEAYVEVLDGSRVHPETYEWARKMAVDALEYDDMAEDANPAGALEEILDNPEKLKDLDLDAFAEELSRQGFGNKSITLYDIRAELNHRYKDLRSPFRTCSSEERFNMLTKETPETFYIGKMILARVAGIAHRKPQGEQLDNANPVRNEESGLWQCPFCMKNDFLEVSDVWHHFDAATCPGQATGVKARLDNGIFGFIPTKFISDKHVVNPEERVKVGMTLHCRVMKIDIERFNCDLTCRTSDLADKNNEWRPAKDVYYDNDIEEKDGKVDEDAKKRQTRQAYIKRVIVHPSFHNISFKDAEKLLQGMDQGETVVRPSSKGADHLTITWKVAEDIYQHIDVREEGKENAFSLGQSLWIGGEEFEDLDEIIARHVQPMAAFARDMIAFRYYRETGGGTRETMEKILMEDKKKAPSKIHYIASASKEFPGKFIMSYLPRTKPRHEYITATPDGLRYRQHTFHSLNSLIRWFKEHFRDPVAGGTPASVTGRTPVLGPSSSAAATTPSINMANLDPKAIQRAAQNLPRHVYNTLTRVASQTPNTSGAQYNSRYGGYNYQPQTPYTPSQPISTPMLTPSYHAVATPSHGVHTPRYHTTPQTNWAHPGHQTPSRTPSRSSGPPKVAPAPSSSSSSSRPSVSAQAAAATDWKKAAELWAMRHQQKSTGGMTPRSTPRASPSIRGSATPMANMDAPAGDSTPLIDEH